MSDHLDPLLLEEVRQIRKLVELLAEPAIAQRDAKLRQELRRIVGNSARKQQAVFLMNGSSTQAEIVTQTSVHKGDLSTMVGKLEGAGLLADGRKRPKLAINIPPSFFDASP